MKIKRNVLNIWCLSIGFMFIYTAFQTTCQIEKIVVESIKTEDVNFTADGYYSLSAIYGVFSVSNWIAPSIITLTGPKGALIVANILFLLFLASFIIESTGLIYTCSVFLGIGLALLWTGHGIYFTVSSHRLSASKNSGIFWGMLQLSTLGGNIFLYSTLRGVQHITEHFRHRFFGYVCGSVTLGLFFLVLLKPISNWQASGLEFNACKAFLKSAVLLCTRNMVLLYPTFSYAGLVLSFISGVYGSSIGFTMSLNSSAKSMVGMSGMFIGVGEVLGGVMFGIFGAVFLCKGHCIILTSGFFAHMIAFILIFLNLPHRSPFGETHDTAVIPTNLYLAMFSAFLLGFGDSVYNTQIYSILSVDYYRNSASAFSLFKFWQYLFTAVSFVYSTHIGLYWQLLILMVFCVIGTLTFYILLNERALLLKLEQDTSLDDLDVSVRRTTVSSDDISI